jgi:hypothetical protein
MAHLLFLLIFLPATAENNMTVTPNGFPGTVTLGQENGRIQVRRDGQPITSSAYCNCILGPHWHEWTDHFIRSGVRIYYLNLSRDGGGSRFWRGEDDYGDPNPDDKGLTIERQAEHILAQRKDALFVVRFGTKVPPKWAKDNPGHMQTDSDGNLFHEASYASEKYLAGLPASFKSIISYCESRPWGKQVIGYMVFPHGEGITPLSLGGNFYDRSEANHQAWRQWLKKKYRNAAALQRSWGDKSAKLTTVEVPTDDMLRQKVESVRHWPAASEMAMERDYALFMRDYFGRWINTIFEGLADATRSRKVLLGIDALKQPLIGWQHNEAFFGTGKGPDTLSMFLSSGSIGVKDLIDHPSLDGLITPADYHARGPGYGFEGEGLSDSMALRKKLLLIENDARTFLSGESPGSRRPPLGSFMNLGEVKAGLFRNTALALSRNLHHYWMDIAGGFFNSDEIQSIVRRDKKVLEAGMNWPHRETEHAIAFVIDDEAPLYGNFTTGFHNLALIRQRIDGLALSGIPYRIYLLSDLERNDFPSYRCYFFPNLFKVDDRIIALLRKKIFHNGSLAIFGPATGITDGKTVSAERAEQLLGIPMEMHERTCSRRIRLRDRTHPALESDNMPPLFGDTYMYGPVLAPDPVRLAKTDCQILGDAVFSFYINTAGLALKEFGRGASGNGKKGGRTRNDYAVVFAGALPLPPQVLKSLARYGGCNVWCEKDAVVSASDTIASIHLTEPGRTELRLPGRYRKVIDAATGKVTGRGISRIILRPKPPETRVFLLEK